MHARYVPNNGGLRPPKNLDNLCDLHTIRYYRTGWMSRSKTLAARGLEELRVNLLLKENSHVSNIILHRSLILELQFYKLYVLMYIMFSRLVKRAFIYNLFYELILF